MNDIQPNTTAQGNDMHTYSEPVDINALVDSIKGLRPEWRDRVLQQIKSPHVPSAVKKYSEVFGSLGAAVVKVGTTLLLDNMGLLGPGCGDTPFAPLECEHLVGELGAKRLEDCLKHKGTIEEHVSVTSVAMEFFGDGVGLASELARLDVSYGGKTTGYEPQYMIAKFSPKELPVRLLAELYRAMESEHLFYEEIKGQLEEHTGIKCPECYFSAFDPSSQRVVILMEDLSPKALAAVRGARPDVPLGRELKYLPEPVPEQLEGVPKADTFEVMELMAKMHSHYWGRRAEGVAEWALPWQHKAFVVTAPLVIKDACGAIAGTWKDITGEVLPELFMQTAATYKKLASRLYSPENSWIQNGPITLIHGDCRRNNMVYIHEEGKLHELYLIDFQMIRWARGEDDIAYYIFSSLADPLGSWEELLQHYHTHLCDRLQHLGKISKKSDYTFEQCAFNFFAGLVWENLTIFLVMAKNADLDRGPAAQLMEKYGRCFFAAQEQCDFPRLMQRMLDPDTFKGGVFDPKALWDCMRRPLKTASPAASL